MTETITQTKTEVALAAANGFLQTERGAGLDGDYASAQISGRVESVGQAAEDLLRSVPHPKLQGLYVPLSAYNANRFEEAAATLPGYLVLMPSSLVEAGKSVFYPAVVSEDGLKGQNIRLHVLRQTYRQQIRYGASILLSAAGQSETKGVGVHGNKTGDGIEAEHFATLLAAGTDKRIQAAWQSGSHVNHTWRGQPDNSVTTEVSKRLFGQDVPQSTITITKQQVEQGKAMLLWHEGMIDEQTGRPETAARDKALLVVQGLGYEALQNSNPKGLDVVRRLIS